ncbi:hypothetical protein DTW90_37440 [Neorhizobium sp. P12A]|nr:hypothetical protein DTW90_37440 [Neorhizobium sp. P12A]
MRVAEKEIDMPVMLEKARLNLWNLVGFVAGITVIAFGWGGDLFEPQQSDRQAGDADHRHQRSSVPGGQPPQGPTEVLPRPAIGMQQQIAQITPLTFQTNRTI